MTGDEQSVGATRRAYDNDALPNQNQTLFGNNRAYRIDGTMYLVFRDRLWRRTGQTRNPRVIALADAVGWNGALLTVHTDGPVIELQHHIGGIEKRLWAGERTEWCFVTFEEVDTFGSE